MKTGMKVSALMLAGAVALAGCSQNGGLFGRGGDAAGADALSADGVGAIEESSVAFFNTEVGDRVLFEVDKHTLSAEAVAILDAQANWLLANTGFNATIEGHADEQGTREYNLALSARRGSSVYNYLVSRGIAENRLNMIPYGKERPLAVCSDESCWSQNRRAVTLVAGGGFTS